MSWQSLVSSSAFCSAHGTYLDLEVGVEQELELEALLALISHGDDRLEPVLAQGDAVDEAKVEGPCLASFLAEA